MIDLLKRFFKRYDEQTWLDEWFEDHGVELEDC